jgi:hypothetical protein
MISVRKSHAILWLAGIGLFFLLALGSSADLGLIPLALAAGGHFIANVAFSVRTRRRRRFRIDPGFLSAHQDSSPEALAEVFEEEKSGGDFVLPVRLDAEVADGSPQRSPWSQAACIGWGIEVDVYKSTILGGDADYTPLDQSSSFDSFQVRSGPSSVRVRPPGIVRGMGAREELLGWTRVDEHAELRRIVDNAMQLMKLDRPKYSGVRVRESTFGKGDVVTVWGTAAKTKTGVEVSGSGAAGAPDALIISPAGRRAARRHPVRAVVRMGASSVLAAAFLALAVVIAANVSWWRLERSYPWLNVEHVGPLHWYGDGKSAEVVCTTLNLTGVSSWSLDPEDDSVNLVSGDEKALVRSRSPITITRARFASVKVSPGSLRYPLFALRAFLFSVPGGTAAFPEVSVHEGSLLVDNRTDTAVEIRFVASTARKDLADLHWTIGPGERTKLVLHDAGFSLTEGDGVLLRRTGESAKRDRFITLGGNPAAAWTQKDQQWVLTVDARALSPRSAPLHARNPNDYSVKVKVFEAGNDTASATWTLPAGFGGANGMELESGGAPFVFNEGESLLIEPLAVDTLYGGPLGSCPSASWSGGVWSLRASAGKGLSKP